MLIPLSSFQGVTTGGVMKCYLKEVDNDGMLCNNIVEHCCYCATPSTLHLKPFFGTSRTDAQKLHP